MSLSERDEVRAVLDAPIASGAFGATRYTAGQTTDNWIVVKAVGNESHVVMRAWKRHNGVEAVTAFVENSLARMRADEREKAQRPCDYDHARAPEEQAADAFGIPPKTRCFRTPTVVSVEDTWGMEMRFCAGCAAKRAGRRVA